MDVDTHRGGHVRMPESRADLLDVPPGRDQRRAVRVAQVVEGWRVLDDLAAALDSLEPGPCDRSPEYPAADVAVIVWRSRTAYEHVIVIAAGTGCSYVKQAA